MSWSEQKTRQVNENSEYRVGIKCQDSSEEDYFIYKVSNIDTRAPEFPEKVSTNINVVAPGNFSEIVKNGVSHFFANNSVNILNISGAIDDISGVASYEIYINNQPFNGEPLVGDGKYEIKVKAYDMAGNESELMLAAYVVISTSKPSCEFVTCSSPSECRSINPIEGTSVSYITGVFKLVGSLEDPIHYKMNCTYEYFEDEEDIFENTIIGRNKFYFVDQMRPSVHLQMDVNSVSISNSQTSCNNGKCSKTNNYLVSIRTYGFDSVANLYMYHNSLCDRVGNCNPNTIVSMDLNQ